MFTIERMCVRLFDRLMNFHATRTSTVVIDDWKITGAFYVNAKRLGLWTFCSPIPHYVTLIYFPFLLFTFSALHFNLFTPLTTPTALSVFFTAFACYFIVSMKLCRTSIFVFLTDRPSVRPIDQLNQNKVGCLYVCVCVCVLMYALWFDEKRQQMGGGKLKEMPNERDLQNSHWCHWQSYFIIVRMRINRMICTQSHKRMLMDNGRWVTINSLAIFRTIRNGKWQRDVKLIPHTTTSNNNNNNKNELDWSSNRTHFMAYFGMFVYFIALRSDSNAASPSTS